MDDPTSYGKRSPLEHERDMEDGFTTVEFLASSCRDVETGEPLEQTARPDLYVHDVQIVIDDWRAMEAEIERLREEVKQARVEGMRVGYLLGFNASTFGYNSESTPEAETLDWWLEEREEAIRAIIDEEEK